MIGRSKAIPSQTWNAGRDEVMARSSTTECETAQHVQRQADSATMTWHTRDLDGLHRTFTVTATVAYVDTIRLFYRGMFPRDQLSWLRARFGRRMFLESWKAPESRFAAVL